MMLWLSNIMAYSAQLAALAGTAVVATFLLPTRGPRASARFWQGLFAISVCLPALQPWDREPSGAMAASLTFISTAGTGTALGTDRLDVVALVMSALAAGGVVRLAWLGAGLLRLRSIIRQAVPADALVALSTELQRELGTHAQLRCSDRVYVPATVGVKQPVVLLPPAVLRLPASVQRAVLCHELIHVSRRDWLRTVFEELWCAVMWFHPGARLIASRACLAREILVDEQTILRTRDRRAYAEALLAFSCPQPALLGATPMIGRRHMSQRIAFIAQEVPMSSTLVATLLALAGVLISLATVVAATSFPMTASVHLQTKVYPPGSGVTLPSVLFEQKPEYTQAAKDKKIQGSVLMSVVVLPDGNVGQVAVTQSLDTEYGLDQQAVSAAKVWKFKPGMTDGEPVAVEVTIQMTFTLK